MFGDAGSQLAAIHGSLSLTWFRSGHHHHEEYDMNKSLKLLLGAIITTLALPTISLADNTRPVDQATQKDLISKASAAGYTDVRNIVMEGEQYVADAAKDGKKVHLFISKNGVVQTVKDGEYKASLKKESTKPVEKQY